MKYMLLIYFDEAWGKLSLTARQQIYEEQLQLSEQLTSNGQYLAGAPLQPPSTATSVRVRDGKPLVTDGPFAETREHLGGFMLIDVKDLDEAIAIAARGAVARVGTVEVRPVQGRPADVASAPGPVAMLDDRIIPALKSPRKNADWSNNVYAPDRKSIQMPASIPPPCGNGGDSPRRKPIMNYALWIVQGLLALLFLFAGGMKLVLPIEALTEQMPLPGLFVRFIGVAEVLGGIGLILPGLLRIRPGLTPLAAVGLVIIMIGATVLTLAGGEVAIGADPAGGGAPCGVRRLRPLVLLDGSLTTIDTSLGMAFLSHLHKKVRHPVQVAGQIRALPLSYSIWIPVRPFDSMLGVSNSSRQRSIATREESRP